MPRATWNGAVLAENDETVVVEGNHYFPPDAVNEEYLVENPMTTVCPWKGVAGYYDVVVGDAVNTGAAWYYSDPSSAARSIKDHVALWRCVVVE